MEKEKEMFDRITARMEDISTDVVAGKMMSSPGIKYKGKVFAFYHNKEMIFRLGRDANPKTFGVTIYTLLNPFKAKPPMKDWFCIPYSPDDVWERLAKAALERMKEKIG